MSAQPDRSVSDLRKEYSAQGLNEAELPATPFSLFKMWFDEAVQSKVSRADVPCDPPYRH
jgi:pyridoxine/pyridoxamine 5'-phosphate oxidase